MKSIAKRQSIDMTGGPMLGPLFAFILPLIGSSIFQQLYNTVDFLFVGNLLNKTSAAAVGAGSTLITCTIGLFSGISVGTSVVMSQAIGAGNTERARKAMHSSVAFGILGGLIMMALGIFFAPDILRVLNTPEKVLPEATVYIRIYLLSLPTFILYNMISGAMRSYGDSQTPFRILVICGIFNVAADAFFMIVIPLGVAGVAIATTVSQALSALLAVIFAMAKEAKIRLNLKEIRIDGDTLKRILLIGLPAGFQTIIITFSNVMVQYYINGFGETAVAAFATYYKVENFIYLPIMAFSQASTTFAGQNYGAGQYRRIWKGTMLMNGIGAGLIFCLAGIILLFPTTVFTWFMKDAGVVEDALKIAFVSFPFYWIYPLLEVTGGALRGMGYAIRSMIIVIANMCVLRIFLLHVFSETFHTIESLASVYPITWAGAAICFLLMFVVVMAKKIRLDKGDGQALQGQGG